MEREWSREQVQKLEHMGDNVIFQSGEGRVGPRNRRDMKEPNHEGLCTP